MAILRALVPVLAAAALALVLTFRHVPMAVEVAYFWVCAVPLLAAVVAGLGDPSLSVAARHGGGALLLLCLVAALGGLLPAHRQQPTDVLEQRLILDRAASIDARSTVIHLGELDRRRLFLPMYGDCRADRPTPILLRSGEFLNFDPFSAPPPVYWYRSSLCSTEEGKAGCDRIEAALPLDLLWEEALPARPSISDLGYLADPVVVKLFRGRR